MQYGSKIFSPQLPFLWFYVEQTVRSDICALMEGKTEQQLEKCIAVLKAKCHEHDKYIV